MNTRELRRCGEQGFAISAGMRLVCGVARLDDPTSRPHQVTRMSKRARSAVPTHETTSRAGMKLRRPGPGKFELTHDRITERRAARMISEIAALRGTRLGQSAASQSRSDCITRACNRRAMAHGTPRLTATLEPHARRA